MKKKNLLLKLWVVIAFVGFISTQSLLSQVTDNTGVFDPALAGTETVYAAVVFNDGDKDGTFDAIFTLSDRAIAGWADYAAVVAFYADRITVRANNAIHWMCRTKSIMSEL
jgi:hypothetical protein